MLLIYKQGSFELLCQKKVPFEIYNLVTKKSEKSTRKIYLMFFFYEREGTVPKESQAEKKSAHIWTLSNWPCPPPVFLDYCLYTFLL